MRFIVWKTEKWPLNFYEFVTHEVSQPKIMNKTISLEIYVRTFRTLFQSSRDNLLYTPNEVPAADLLRDEDLITDFDLFTFSSIKRHLKGESSERKLSVEKQDAFSV